QESRPREDVGGVKLRLDLLLERPPHAHPWTLPSAGHRRTATSPPTMFLPSMRLARGTVSGSIAVAISLVLAACGRSSNSSSSASSGATTPPTVPSVKQFPKVRGRTMAELAQNLKTAAQLAPSVSVLR